MKHSVLLQACRVILCHFSQVEGKFLALINGLWEAEAGGVEPSSQLGQDFVLGLR